MRSPLPAGTGSSREHSGRSLPASEDLPRPSLGKTGLMSCTSWSRDSVTWSMPRKDGSDYSSLVPNKCCVAVCISFENMVCPMMRWSCPGAQTERRGDAGPVRVQLGGGHAPAAPLIYGRCLCLLLCTAGPSALISRTWLTLLSLPPCGGGRERSNGVRLLRPFRCLGLGQAQDVRGAVAVGDG
jgi:hypothetical protein